MIKIEFDFICNECVNIITIIMNLEERYMFMYNILMTHRVVGRVVWGHQDVPCKIFNNTFQYRFCSDSNECCPICYENFKKNDIMKVNSCYHYWCNNCENNFAKLVCPYCNMCLKMNEFLNSAGECECFQKN